MTFFGEVPVSENILGVFDAKQFEKNVEKLALSCEEDMHIHVCDPNQNSINLSVLIEAVSKNRISFSFNEGGSMHFDDVREKLGMNPGTSIFGEFEKDVSVNLKDILSVIDVVILFPRVDIRWENKKQMETPRESFHEVFHYWGNFVEDRMTYYASEKKNVLLVSDLKWKFHPSLCESFKDGTTFYIPHTRLKHFDADTKRFNMKFFHQTVFPFLFTVDSVGWGGDASYIGKFNPKDSFKSESFEELRDGWTKKSKSKYVQRETKEDIDILKWDNDFIFVPIQTMNDETIKFDFDDSVTSFVEKICRWSDKKKWGDAPKIVFKAHPRALTQDPAGCSKLKSIIKQFKNVQYVENVHIKKLIEKSKAVYVINSGVGQEAMLLDKTVVTFGRCDYKPATIEGDIDDLEYTYKKVIEDDMDQRMELYRKWFHWWINHIVVRTRQQNSEILTGGRKI